VCIDELARHTKRAIIFFHVLRVIAAAADAFDRESFELGIDSAELQGEHLPALNQVVELHFGWTDCFNCRACSKFRLPGPWQSYWFGLHRFLLQVGGL
jgi:hypothetical protein